MQLAWIFDFHTPGYVRVGAACDFDGAAATLAAAEVQAVILHAKCHFGFSYYPTRVGTPHPRLEADVFGGLSAAFRRQGISAEAYISFGIDGAAGEERPEWRRIYADGSADPSGWFINICPFTSYVEERVLPQIDELFREYRPSGYWFDTMSALSPCYCPECRAAFRRDAGADLPVADDDSLQAQAGQWRHARGFALVTRVAEFIRSLDPKAQVGFNQLGSLPFPEPMPAGVTVLTLDPETAGPQSIPFSLNAAYGSHGSKPSEIMPTIFHGGWGDWSPASPRRLETTAFACWTRGTKFTGGDRLHPEGRLTRFTPAALEIVGGVRATWGRCAPAAGAKLAPDVVILHSPSLTSGPARRWFAVGDPRSRLTPINGMHRLLLDAGFNFTVAAEWQLAEAMDGVALIVIPEIPELEPETERQLLEFAERGGALLFTGKLPQVGGRPFAGTGVELGGTVWQDHVYLPRLGEGGDSEVLVRGSVREAVSVGATAVHHLIAAYDARPGHRYGWGVGPSSHQISTNPALTTHACGRGKIWFLNALIADDYAKMGSWPQSEWMGSLLSLLAPGISCRLSDSGGNLELIVWRHASSIWLYLIDHEGEQLVGEGRWWARSQRNAAPREFRLRLARESGSPRLHILHGGETAMQLHESHLDLVGNFSPPFGALRVDWETT